MVSVLWSGRYYVPAETVARRRGAVLKKTDRTGILVADVKIRFLPPPPDLRAVVETFWTLEGAEPSAEVESPRRVLPDGRPELIVHYGAPYRRHQAGAVEDDPRTFLFGQLSEPLDLAPRGAVRTVAARLRPAVLGRLTRTRASEFVGRPVPLDEVWDGSGAAWSQRLLECNSASEAVEVLSDQLRTLWPARSPSAVRTLDAAVLGIERHQGRQPIAALAVALGCSTRHLERLFRDHLGLGPKAFARVVRFQAALRAVEDPGTSLIGQGAELALAFGFSDQAHLIREFRTFSGFAPAEYQRFRRANEPRARTLFSARSDPQLAGDRAPGREA